MLSHSNDEPDTHFDADHESTLKVVREVKNTKDIAEETAIYPKKQAEQAQEIDILLDTGASIGISPLKFLAKGGPSDTLLIMANNAKVKPTLHGTMGPCSFQFTNPKKKTTMTGTISFTNQVYIKGMIK